MVSSQEIERRYSAVRAAMEEEGVDALLVCGNQYSGFEGAVRYLSGFEIVHRYAYVLVPLVGECDLIFPREARWIGDKKKPWVQRHHWPDVPGRWLSERVRAKGWERLAVYGADFVLTVRDYRELQEAPVELVPFDRQFDLARAVKSLEELDSVRDSMRIIEEGFWALLEAFRPGRTEAEIMAPAVELFFAGGAGPRMMNIVLSGSGGEAEAHFKVPGSRIVGRDDLLLYSLEITGLGGYWVEFSRPLIAGTLSPRTQRMADIYPEALEAGRLQMRDGVPAREVHRAAAEVLEKSGFGLGHLSGHSIGMTMIEHPAIGAETETLLRENMVLSFHPQVVDPQGECCLYTQDTFLVGRQEGISLSRIPWQVFTGRESRPTGAGA